MRKILSWLLIIIGLGVIVYPFASEAYFTYQQDKILSSWEEGMLTLDQIDESEEVDLSYEVVQTNDDGRFQVTASDESIVDILEKERAAVNAELEQKENEAQREAERKAAEKKKREDYMAMNMEGIIDIPSIDLHLPIMTKATDYHLMLSVASVENTGKAGRIGNYVIAGHRNRTYSRNFNRLNEVRVGDDITITTGNGKYVYTVTDTFRVLPENIGVLFGSDTEKLITLITCDPIVNSTHRLIVRGAIKE